MGDSANATNNQSCLNLFVKNLDEGINSENLRKEFAIFGAVKSAKVVSKDGLSKGFGFVSFSNPTDAQSALSAMNGSTLGSKKVAVMFVTSIETNERISPTLTTTSDSNYPVDTPSTPALHQNVDIMSSFQPSHLGCPPSTLKPCCQCGTGTLLRTKIVDLKQVQSDGEKALDNGLFSHPIPSPTSAILTSQTKPNNRSGLGQPEKSNVDDLKKFGAKKRLDFEPKKVVGKNNVTATKEIVNSKVTSETPTKAKLTVSPGKPTTNKTTNVCKHPLAKHTIITTQSSSVSPKAINSKTPPPTHVVNIVPAVSTAPSTPLRPPMHPMCRLPCCPTQATLIQNQQVMGQYSPRLYGPLPVTQFQPMSHLQPGARCFNGPNYQQSFTAFQPVPHYQPIVQFQPGPRFQPLPPHQTQYPIMVSFPPLPQPMAGFYAPVQPPVSWRGPYSPTAGFVAPLLCPACSSPAPCRCANPPVVQVVSGMLYPPPLMVARHMAPINPCGEMKGSMSSQETGVKVDTTFCDANSNNLQYVIRKLNNFQHPNFNFTPTARNLKHKFQAAAPETPRNNTPTLEATLHIQGQEPLTASMLASAKPEEQKQMLGERLLPLIKEINPGLADKITNMLLEMDNSEIVHMLDHHEYLKEMSVYADTVIKSHQDQTEKMSNDIVSSIEKLVC